MKIQPYLTKLNSSSEYKDFTKKNSDAFMVAAFFVLDLESGKNQHVIDYYVPSKKKVVAFTLDNQITVQMMDLMAKKAPEKLDLKTKIDLDALQGILEDEMKNRNITDEIKKIIAVVQMIDSKKIWNLNCMLSGMGILNAHVEDSSGTVLRMEKKSFMDIVRKLPAEEVKKQMAAAQGKAATDKTEDEEVDEKIDPKESESKSKEIERAIAAIEKEKVEILKNSKKAEKSGLPKKR
jgi:hypothetical protein